MVKSSWGKSKEVTSKLSNRLTTKRRCEMQMKPENLPIIFERDGSSLHSTEWVGMAVLLYTIPAGTDMEPLFAGLPEDMCQCPHWGYELKGRLRIRHVDHDLVGSAEDVFFVEPEHAPVYEEDTQMIEFSPKEPWYAIISTIARNMAALS
jgi:hypothetical protein